MEKTLIAAFMIMLQKMMRHWKFIQLLVKYTAVIFVRKNWKTYQIWRIIFKTNMKKSLLNLPIISKETDQTVISMTQKCTTMRIFLIKSEENLHQENLQHKKFTTKAFTPQKFKEHLNRNWTQEINLILKYKKVFRALGKIDSNVYWVTLVAVTVYIIVVVHCCWNIPIYLSKTRTLAWLWPKLNNNALQVCTVTATRVTQ